MSSHKHYSHFVSDVEEEYAGACKLKKGGDVDSLAIPNKVQGREREIETERKNRVERIRERIRKR